MTRTRETIDIDQTYDLALAKTLLSAGPFQQGSVVIFNIAVTNEGSLDAADVIVEEPRGDGTNLPEPDAQQQRDR